MGTVKWPIPRIWEGETVAVLGTANMSEKLAKQVRGRYKCIAVHQAIKYAPWADVYLALDPDHHADLNGFRGIRVCGIESDDVDAFYPGMMYEMIALRTGGHIELRNNYLAALRVAERMGAAKILMLGVDAPAYDDIHAHTGFHGFAEALPFVIADIRSKGIVVEELKTDGKEK